MYHLFCFALKVNCIYYISPCEEFDWISILSIF